jgi:hypothetical protein
VTLAVHLYRVFQAVHLYRVFQFKKQPELLHVTVVGIEFLQPCLVAADALLENGTAVISAVLSLVERLSRADISYAPKCPYSSVYCGRISYFLVRIRIAKCPTKSSK